MPSAGFSNTAKTGPGASAVTPASAGNGSGRTTILVSRHEGRCREFATWELGVGDQNSLSLRTTGVPKDTGGLLALAAAIVAGKVTVRTAQVALAFVPVAAGSPLLP